MGASWKRTNWSALIGWLGQELIGTRPIVRGPSQFRYNRVIDPDALRDLEQCLTSGSLQAEKFV